VGNRLRGDTIGQVTQTHQGDIPYHVTSCSAIQGKTILLSQLKMQDNSGRVHVPLSGTLLGNLLWSGSDVRGISEKENILACVLLNKAMYRQSKYN